jgi:hypothetical protein
VRLFHRPSFKQLGHEKNDYSFLLYYSDNLGAFSLGSAAEGLWRVTLSNEDIYKAWAKGYKVDN